MDLQLNYQCVPFSISPCQSDLWKILYLRSLQRISTLPAPEEGEPVLCSKLKLASAGKVGPFLTFRVVEGEEQVKANAVGVTLQNPFLRYSVTVYAPESLTGLTVYHGASQAELCLSDNFQPLKYCDQFYKKKFVVTGYHHLYFATCSPVAAGDVSLTISVEQSSTPVYHEKTYGLRNQTQTLPLCKARRKGSDFEFICSKEMESVYRCYASALHAEVVPFPRSAVLASAALSSVAIRFEKQPGYTGSYVFASVTDDRRERGYIPIEHGRKLRMKYETVKFEAVNANAKAWMLRAYGTNRRCLGTWSCARLNVEAVFDQTENVRFVIENELEVSDPGGVELEQYLLELV